MKKILAALMVLSSPYVCAQTPAPIIESLNAAMKTWLATPETLERFKTMAGYADWMSPADYKKFVDTQIALWKGVIDKEGLKLDAN